MNLEKVCVLGGTGFIGQQLAARLVNRGLQVKVLTRHREKTRENLILLPTLDLVEANIHDPDQLKREFEGMDAVINLVGILHERKSGDFARVHAELPGKVVAAAQSAGVRQILHMSALKASPEGPSEYQKTKAAGEAAALAANSDSLWVTAFRPSVVFGRGDSFLSLFARLIDLTPVMTLPCPDARFQPVWVGDVAEAFSRSLSNPAVRGQVYELCGPQAYSFEELVRYVGQLRGKRPFLICMDDSLSHLYARMMELLPVKLLSRDNVLSMRVPNVCDCPFPPVFGITPMALEAIAPEYLAMEHPRARYMHFRSVARELRRGRGQ
jgi:NADH dehydrogenase